MEEPGELSREDWLEKTALRAIKAIRSGEKDFAEELMIDVLYLIGRGDALERNAVERDE